MAPEPMANQEIRQPAGPHVHVAPGQTAVADDDACTIGNGGGDSFVDVGEVESHSARQQSTDNRSQTRDGTPRQPRLVTLVGFAANLLRSQTATVMPAVFRRASRRGAGWIPAR